jgi:NAD(P)H-nitrite reductase large subunit
MLKDGEKGAALQVDRETYGIAPNLECGELTPALLRKLAEVAEKYQVPAMKITGANRIALLGVKESEIDSIWSDLGLEPGSLLGLCVRSVRCCPGIAWCRLGQTDAMEMGRELTRRYHGMELPNKLKIAVSGCPINCAEGWVRDIGLFGRSKKWVILVGGNVGSRPRLAQELIADLDDGQARQAVAAVVDYYRAHAKRGHRLGRMAADQGLEPLLQAVRQALGLA